MSPAVLPDPAPRQRQPQPQHRPGSYFNHMYVKLSCWPCSLHIFSSFLQQGNKFFDTWDFFTDPDPTHGAFHPSTIGSFFSK